MQFIEMVSHLTVDFCIILRIIETRGVDYAHSALYSIANFFNDDGTKIRKDESCEKHYLLGKYGAIPHLKVFDMFKRE